MSSKPGPVRVLHLCPSPLGLGSPLGVTVPRDQSLLAVEPSPARLLNELC